MSGIDV
ncbi:hypothetical protein OCT59_004823 [Rhizophagus irregularis]|nr:hypothetical protein OCT59_004823 [Rhizophagus irregularis]